MEDKLIVTFDKNNGDIPFLVVSRKLADGTIEIINGLKGDIAVDLYNTLTSWIIVDDKEDE